MHIRLDKLLANMGYGSRREINILARNGHITLDGEALTDAAMRLPVTADLPVRMQINGEYIDPLPGMALMLHKQLGMSCSHKESGPLIYDLLPSRFRARQPQISSIGRLDKDTSGLLLLTDDGALLHKIISPKNHVAKQYMVTLDRPIGDDAAAIFSSGTLLLESEEKPLLPAQLQIINPQLVRVILHEGRYHQVRRMFAAIGNHANALHREKIGGLDLPETLLPGQFRTLAASEIERIFWSG